MRAISVLLLVVAFGAAAAEDHEQSQWHPMWSVVLTQSGGLGVPLRLWVDKPPKDAARNGVTKTMVEDVVELGLRRNAILVKRVTSPPDFHPYLHVTMRALKVEGEPTVVYRIDYRLQGHSSVRPIPRHGGPYSIVHTIWTHGVLGYASGELLAGAVRRYLSETTDDFSLDFLETKIEVEADLARQLKTLE